MNSSICPGPIPRRTFLRFGMLAAGGLTLADLLEHRAAADNHAPETSVILFWMWGGPSQLETYDMKPDAPSEYRGPFDPIRTTVPGMDICRLLPRQARIAEKFSIVRSLHHDMSAHNDGSIEVLTGKTPRVPDPTSQARSEHPDFGMVAAKVRGPRPDGLPQYIGVQRAPFMTTPAYLGLSHKAFDTGDPSKKGFAPKNLHLIEGIDDRRLTGRRGLLTALDRTRRNLDLAGSMEGLGKFHDAAFSILTSPKVAQAFELEREPDALRDRYGRHRWGQSCLLARRLVEAGAAVVNVDATAPSDTSENFSWDDHAGPFHLVRALEERLPQMDQAIATLIEDLDDCGMGRNVLVIACGEFGRTPRLTHRQTFPGKNGGPWLGRDHWPQAFSALVAGGGLRMGQVVGGTNSKSEYPTQHPVTPQDLMATIYRHLGIDPGAAFIDFAGRPVPILYRGRPIPQLV